MFGQVSNFSRPSNNSCENLEIKTVVRPHNEDEEFSVDKEAYPGSGVLINSDFLNGLEAPENSIHETIKILEERKLCKLGSGR